MDDAVLRNSAISERKAHSQQVLLQTYRLGPPYHSKAKRLTEPAPLCFYVQLVCPAPVAILAPLLQRSLQRS
jgi:hypothetical protein